MADVMVLTNLWPTIMSAFGAGSGFTVACCIRWGASPCYLDQDDNALAATLVSLVVARSVITVIAGADRFPEKTCL